MLIFGRSVERSEELQMLWRDDQKVIVQFADHLPLEFRDFKLRISRASSIAKWVV